MSDPEVVEAADAPPEAAAEVPPEAADVPLEAAADVLPEAADVPSGASLFGPVCGRDGETSVVGPPGGGLDDKYRRMIQQAFVRQAWAGKYFASQDALEAYVAAHPLAALIPRRAMQEVSLHRTDLARLAKAEGIADVEHLPALEQYRLLADSHYVEPSELFPEVPKVPSGCEMKELWAAFLKAGGDPKSDTGKTIVRDFQAAISYFLNRLQSLTGESFDEGKLLPHLSRLTERIAPVPFHPSWSEDYYGREARSLGHVGADGAPAPPPRNRAAAAAGGGAAAAGNGHDAAAAAPGIHCDLGAIYAAAGAAPLHQPGPGEARYTFPGTLNWGEDIFYDFAVMVPLPLCEGTEVEAGATYPRSLAAAYMAAGQGRALLHFLRDQVHLDGALGQYDDHQTVVDYLDDLMGRRVVVEAAGLSPADVRALKRELREAAALLRAISTTRLFVDEGLLNPFDLQPALDQALAELPSYEQFVQPAIINDQEQPHNVDNLRFVNLPNGVIPPDIDGNARNSIGPGPVVKHNGAWYIDANQQRRSMADYLVFLADYFYGKLNQLRDSARAVDDALQSLARNGPGALLSNFQRAAAETLNDVIASLARLLEAIAELLTPARTSPAEGNKRLALMVVFRQYWYPEGYVAGKLVGYKNLLPSQRDTLKRRTFVKTTRELTTAQEFTAARENDFSQSSKETSEVTREAANQFNFSATASGKFDLLIVNGDLQTTTGLSLSETSKAMQSRVAEATMKGSSKYSEKREVKIRELSETEDVQEVTTELPNQNAEITANYFYYQLYRQYLVTLELHSVQPVLLRTLEVPSPAAVDEKFLADYAHILLAALPDQLSVDLQETVSQMAPLGRTLIRRRADSQEQTAAYELFRQSPPPTDADARDRWQAQLDTLSSAASDARSAYIDAEEGYLRARDRLDRVIRHVRENIRYYMQFIWSASPKVDQDQELQDETFNGIPLPALTRGLIRYGYFGDEEIFEYTGPTAAGLNALVGVLTAGYEIVGSMTDAELRQTPLYAQLHRYYPSDTDEMLIDRIRTHLFIRDPSQPDTFDARRVQIAQDALVVEALPGQVPLLEGFQMAQRALNVDQSCLQNDHLAKRIDDRPWQRTGDDTYRVYRREGEPIPAREDR